MLPIQGVSKIHGITSGMSSSYVDNKKGYITIGPEMLEDLKLCRVLLKHPVYFIC
jgi:hypothetical protein